MFIQAYKGALQVLAKKPIMLWGLSLLSCIIVTLACGFSLAVPIIGILFGFLISCGMAKVYLDGLEGKEVNSNQLFAAFGKNAGRVMGGMSWQALWTIIWSSVPVMGIIKGYAYSFVPYILITKPEVSPTDALRLSMKMTNGYKAQMFLADLCLVLIIGFVVAFLSLLCAIPFVGVLFAFVLFIVSIVICLFSSIFVGLYKAWFYTKAASTYVPAE